MTRERTKTGTLSGVVTPAIGNIPDGYPVRRVTSLRTAIDAFETATDMALGYFDEAAGDEGEWVQSDDYYAVVNPDWLGDGADDAPNGSALWTPRTKRYDIVNPADCYDPLVTAIDDAGIDRGGIFGERREYRYGGEFYLDVFFPSITAAYPTDAKDGEDAFDDLILGLSTGSDHLGRTTLFAQPIAYDPNTGATFRHLGEKNTRRHVKSSEVDAGESAEEVAAWWKGEISRLETVSDTLFQALHDASTYEFDLRAVPKTLEDFFDTLGIPDVIAADAASRVSARGPWSAWEVGQSLLLAIRKEFGGRTDGKAMRDHVRVANEILFHPPVAERAAFDAWASEAAAGPSQMTLGGDSIAATYEAAAEDATDRVATYQTLRERVSGLLREAAEREADDESDDSNDTDAALTTEP